MTARVADRVNAERLVLVGWTRAILLQVAHPLIAAAVADHSAFRDTPAASVRRLHHTVKAMLGLTFGSPDEYRRVIEGIRAIHRRVNGRLREAVGPFPAGTPYSAEDPALLLWVHVSLIESTLLVHEALVGPLSAADRDEYCADAARVAIELGAREADVPRDWEALERCVSGVLSSGVLAVGADARAISAALLTGGAVRLAGPATWANRRLTAAWLPADLRRQYGLPWSERHERQAAAVERFLRRVRPVLPRALAKWRAAR